MRTVAALAVSLVACAAVLPAASSAARARMDSHRAVRGGGGTGVDRNGLDGAASAAAGAPLPYQISDSFNGTSINSNLWYTGGEPAGTTQGVQGGALQLTASADAAWGPNPDSILTQCQAVGDFTAEIHFTLSTWPAGDNVALALSYPPLGEMVVQSNIGGDVYGFFVGTAGVVIPASVTSGELLVSRRGGLMSAYARSDAGRWQLIGRENAPTSNVYLGPGIYSVPPPPFGGQPVSVAVESFKLDAQGLSCP